MIRLTAIHQALPASALGLAIDRARSQVRAGTAGRRTVTHRLSGP